jgi:hypothetical protein
MNLQFNSEAWNFFCGGGVGVESFLYLSYVQIHPL